MKSTELTAAIEAALAAHPTARRIAVENFCGTTQTNKLHIAMNLAADARAYGWKPATTNAIKQVLDL